jgi:CRP/FNR family cyclic AMP-dependent transcriptional regulator
MIFFRTMIEHLEDLIEKSFLFKSLDEQGRKMLYNSGNEMLIEAGSDIVQEGGKDRSFYIVKTGSVRVWTGKAGKEKILARLGPGAIFGEISYLSGSPRTATVTAESECQIIMFEKDKVDKVVNRYPTVKKLMSKVMSGRADDTAKKLSGSAE